MMCCVGLFGGLALGQAMGGPWTVIAPAAGFGAGFLVDMKLMKGMHGHGHRPQPAVRQEPPLSAEAETGAPPQARPYRATGAGEGVSGAS